MSTDRRRLRRQSNLCREARGPRAPDTLGRPRGSGKLEPYREFLIHAVTAQPDITKPELSRHLEDVHAVVAHPASVSRYLRKAGFAYKKTLIASERQRNDAARKGHNWIHGRQPTMREMAHRLVFIDETSTNTKFTRLRGRTTARRRAARTFVHCRLEVLRADGTLDNSRPNGPDAFDTYIETHLAPTLSPGDVVILDNLKVHDSAKTKAALAERGAWFLILPPYSPDLNPSDRDGVRETQGPSARRRCENL